MAHGSEVGEFLQIRNKKVRPRVCRVGRERSAESICPKLSSRDQKINQLENCKIEDKSRSKRERKLVFTLFISWKTNLSSFVSPERHLLRPKNVQFIHVNSTTFRSKSCSTKRAPIFSIS